MFAKLRQRFLGRGQPDDTHAQAQSPRAAQAEDVHHQEEDEILQSQILEASASDEEQDAASDSGSATSARRRATEHFQREQLLRRQARHRWKADIKPRSQQFQQVLAAFEQKLKESSVQEILEGYFSKHERDLVMPADKRFNRALARIQRRNKARYRILVRSKRFLDVVHEEASLKLKLTMLYFGLPVSPFTFDAAEEWDDDSDTADEMVEVENEKRREEAAKKQNTLRFLNSYSVRYMGKDNLREPDPIYEQYYAFNHLYRVATKKTTGKRRAVRSNRRVTVPLRGGGLDEAAAGMDLESFNESDIDVEHLVDSGSDMSNADLAEHSQDTLDPLGISLRGGAGDISQASPVLLQMAENTNDRLYKPPTETKGTEATKHSVSFQIDQIHAANQARRAEQAKQDAIRAGKRLARDDGLAVDADNVSPTQGFKNSYLQPDKTPPRRTDDQRAREARETAYAKPPSIHTANTFPLNAPPVEKVLQFGSDSVPKVSVGVLTPSEQHKLQIDYYNLRNIVLDRSQKCPYAGCGRVIALGDTERMQKHLRDAHTGDACNFCGEVLFEHWTVNQRRGHFLTCHTELFLRRVDRERDSGFASGKGRPHGQVDYDRESRWKFCARCGRRHADFDARADREHHDAVCYPGAPKGSFAVCRECGVIHSKTVRHKCRKEVDTRQKPFCPQCGLALGLFTDLYRARHEMYCLGFGDDDAEYCPWCGHDIEYLRGQRMHHIENCSERTHGAQGPFDPATGMPWPYKPPIEEQELEEDQMPPELCTLCKKPFVGLDAHMVLKHLEEEHDEFAMTFCIFCRLSYERRGWDPKDNRKQVLRHLDDHIHDRKEALAFDLVESLNLPWNHPRRQRVLRAKHYAEVKDLRELEELEQTNDILFRSVKQMVDEKNEDKATIAMLRAELDQRPSKQQEAIPPGTAASGNTVDVPETSLKPAKPAVTSKPAATSLATPPNKDQTQQGSPKKTNVRPKPSRPAASPTTASGINTGQPTPPTTTTKPRPNPRPASTRPKPHDPSYTPRPPSSTSSSSALSSSEDDLFRSEESKLRAATKRKRTMNQDPSYRPPRNAEETDGEDEEMDRGLPTGRKKRKRRAGAAVLPP